ncbi:hypothetical protein [uncultured Campylobacter sp.]|uniref:hypothetical protein n=1 Tax=uncultured Campylobacter sp. TaxID=218934 RepID=UPI00260F79F7|nr:hypothetical protein [uncultured Campylobacter sp.]
MIADKILRSEISRLKILSVNFKNCGSCKSVSFSHVNLKIAAIKFNPPKFYFA